MTLPGQPNGNGNGQKAWLQWVNTVLIILVAGLLSMFISANEHRLTKLEDSMDRQERVSKLEDEVRRQGLEQAARRGRIESLESEVARLRDNK